MPKHYKEMMDEIINKMDEEKENLQYLIKSLQKRVLTADPDKKADLLKRIQNLKKQMTEDAPANAVGSGANVALPPAVEPGVKKKDDKRDPLMFAKPLKRKIKESDDNNNVVLKNIIDRIGNIEIKLDEKVYGKTEFKIEEEKEYNTFRDKYNAKKI